MNQDFYISLIYKRIQHLLEPEEEQKLAYWLQESPKNQALAREIEIAWENSDSLVLPTVELDLEAEFSQLLENIEAVEEKNIEMRPRSFPWLRVAAAVLVLVLIGYSIWNRGGGDSEWKEIAYTGEDKAHILPDGSKIWLKEGATVKYQPSFASNKRELELSGEAFFDVKHQDNTPFLVNCTFGTVQVLGTTFTVNERLKQERMEVVVVSGRVQLSAYETMEKIVLEANEKGVWNEANKTLKHYQDVSLNEVAWHTKNLVFEDTPLNEVLETLQKTYSIELNLVNKALAGCPFSLVMQTEDPSEYFEIFQEVFGIEVVKLNNQAYRFEGGTCP
ncbi:MAG: FecR domain-containing protein [Bacteroidota bacterium]